MTPRGPNFFLNSGVLRVVLVLRFLFGIEVVEVAEELVEAVRRRQEFVAVAEVVLAELASHVALRFQELRDGRVFLLQALRRAGQADLGQPGPEGHLTGEESRAPGGTALLTVVVGEHRTFVGDAIDVRRRVADHAAAIGTHVEDADIVAENDQDVGLLGCPTGRSRGLGLLGERGFAEPGHDQQDGPQGHQCSHHRSLHRFSSPSPSSRFTSCI